MNIITAAIFLMGVATVALSLAAAAIFQAHQKKAAGASKKLSVALKWQLVGESIIGLGTVLFSCAAHFGWLDFWSEEFQSSIRFTMFFATSTTTLHLVRTVNRIANE